MLLEKHGTFEDIPGGVDLQLLKAEDAHCFIPEDLKAAKKMPIWGKDEQYVIYPGEFTSDIVEILERSSRMLTPTPKYQTPPTR